MERVKTRTSASSLRWGILRRALLNNRSSSSNLDDEPQMQITRVSRKTGNGFNLIPFHVVGNNVGRDSVYELSSRDAHLCYTLPIEGAPQLVLFQRMENHANLTDFKICNRYNIDNTGLICQWPSEDVLAYFCLSHADMFRSKRVIELGSGYGLAGLVIAAVSEASEVIISDGNPQVVDYIQRSIASNHRILGGTKVKSLILHWNEEEIPNLSNSFDIIVASDCTFFKDFHKSLVHIVRSLLKHERTSEAIFLSPKRGDTLDKFLEEVKACGLHFSILEKYDDEVWNCHLNFMNGDESWPSYEKDHCYPLMIRITH